MEVSFTINGEPYTVTPATVPIDTTLNTFIRHNAQLHGTKFMCLEGGCGVCIVTLKGVHPVTKKPKTWATNSCLTNIYSCHGLDILTVEGIGNKHDGYHPVQKRLADLHGTQCGFCSPGMVMNMYSLLESTNGQITMEEVENSFGGNICRCTGYRPILDAFKSLAVDSSYCFVDIEDIPKICKRNGEPCVGTCNKRLIPDSLHLKFGENREWFKVLSLQTIFDIFDKIGDKPYMLVAGNTAHGVYRRDRNLQVFIDITDVSELQGHILGDNLIIGANTSLTEMMDILTKASEYSGYEYCKHLVKHIDIVANVPVRNNGTIAGNLSIKHMHKEFPSDIFIMLEACCATLTIAESPNKVSPATIATYLDVDMNKKVLLKVTLPKLDPSIYIYRSYKIMPRAQNAHAYVNAGFFAEIRNGKVVQSRICFGGIEPSLIHAVNTENTIKGKDLHSDETLKEAIASLKDELRPDWVLPDASPDYRKNLAISLFYKFIISTCPPNKVSPQFVSGGEILERTLSSGTQEFDTYKKKWPLTQPVPKYEAQIQTSGEALYANDITPMKDELWAAFVVAKKPHAIIGKIDPSNALKIPGVFAFYSAKDIPGKNNFAPPLVFINEEEKVFLGENDEVLFYGYPVGVILANTNDLAHYAADFVKITYISNVKNPSKPIMPTILDGYGWDGKTSIHHFGQQKNNKKFIQNVDETKTIQGNFQIGSQYHFTMEPQTTVCIPAEDGIDLYTATQWMDLTNIAVAEFLNIGSHNVNMTVRRIGGGFGAKVSRGSQIACAAGLACRLTNRPIRFVMSIESNMLSIGKRFAIASEYDITFDDTGKISKLKNNYAEDNGYSINDSVSFLTNAFFPNCYIHDPLDNQGERVRTDAPCHTWYRGPGSTEGIGMIENMMEHISRVLKKEPIDVRLANIAADHPMKKILPEFVKDVDFYKRRDEVDEFNKQNRWRKRGIAVQPMQYPMEYVGPLPAFVAIYHNDGTVAVTHGGVECGQGVNTKVAQVAAYTLGVPLEFISIKPMNNVVSANSYMTGASTTSEAICFSVKKACEELNARIKPVRDETKSGNWKEIVQACYWKNIDLKAQYSYTPAELKPYSVYGVACGEIEVDLLTGNVQVKRVDILEDTGESISPNVDVGQIEGSFINGLGYWLTESLIYNRVNGELLSTRTWTYKPPGPKDIPIDFRIKFLQKSKNPFGVLGSKATGEPALVLSYVIILALRYLLESAQKDAGMPENYFHLGAPCTPDVIFLNSGIDVDQFKLIDK